MGSVCAEGAVRGWSKRANTFANLFGNCLINANGFANLFANWGWGL